MAIEKIKNVFCLNTNNTTYAFRLMKDCGLLEHMYYGRRIHICGDNGMSEQHTFAPGNSIALSSDMQNLSLEDICLELSSRGKGDIREPFIEVIFADGSRTSDFRYVSSKKIHRKEPLSTLPSSYDDEGLAEQLIINLEDKIGRVELKLVYSVFPECDVISRSAVLTNKGEKAVKLARLMSNQLDIQDSGYVFTTFNGAWSREMKRNDTYVTNGKVVNSSVTGTSSNRSNPFCMLSETGTNENAGACYGFNLIYSGNHCEMLEVNAFGKTRFLQGINPDGFEYLINSGESFEAPEAIMSFSNEGFNGLSGNLHEFVREHIVRGEYKNKSRPVLLNSWEAAYFDINSSNLLKLAKAGKDVGIELFVVDDGWFGERNDDTTSLGDWTVNEKKLPGGIKALSNKITSEGLKLGIWVEPEMVNVKSRLYEEHPEWSMDIPGREHSEGRNQRLLDLANVEVQDYIIEAMSKVFADGDISYVKWDMNRIVSDCFSKALPAERQGEVLHRYVLGLYRCMDELTKRFPHILFEGCASGGNRFDLGILCYFPQIWASDNTDALCRGEIQNGYSYGYPLSVISAHVSGIPNHQTLRRTPMESRFHVAFFGMLGYELNLCDLSKEDREQIKVQIEIYKQWRDVVATGRFFRGRNFADASAGQGGSGMRGNLPTGGSVLSGSSLLEWCVVSKDQTRAVGMVVQPLVHPNTQFAYFRANGLRADWRYHLTNNPFKVGIKEFGDLINTVSPVHIKQDSLVHNIAAKFVKLNSATEDHVMYGDAYMYAGVKLKQAFSGTGLNDQVRIMPDFGSELFFMEKVADEAKE